MATTQTQLAPPMSRAVTEESGPPMYPSEGTEAEADTKSLNSKVRFFFFMMSIYGMFMLVMIPCWNCFVLLQSWIYSQLLGAQAPLTFLLLLIGIVCVFTVLLTLFMHTARVELQTFQTIVMMGSAILTFLGVMFMLFGHEVAELSRTAQKDVEHNCAFSQATEPLFVESKILYALRFNPECAAKVSVEECPGFRVTHASQVLKALEINLKCSTFCSDVIPPQEEYPMTLFSRASYKPTCQMTLVRNLKFYVEDMGTQAYFQGCMLVLTSVAIGLLKLIGFCAPQRRMFSKDRSGSFYGSIDSSSLVG